MALAEFSWALSSFPSCASKGVENIRPFGHSLAYLFSVLTESELSVVLNA